MGILRLTSAEIQVLFDLLTLAYESKEHDGQDASAERELLRKLDALA